MSFEIWFMIMSWCVIWILIHDHCHDTFHLNFDQWSLSWYSMWFLDYSFPWIVTYVVPSMNSNICFGSPIRFLSTLLSTLWICKKEDRYIFVWYGPCILSWGIKKDVSLMCSISIMVAGWYLSMATNFFANIKKEKIF